MKMPDLMSRITGLLCGYCKLISFYTVPLTKIYSLHSAWAGSRERKWQQGKWGRTERLQCRCWWGVTDRAV